MAQLADEHVDRAVAADHRVAPHPLVDVLALEHPAVRRRQLAQQLVFLAREPCGLGADVRVEAVRADRQLAGDDGFGVGRHLAGAATAHDRLNARDQLLRVARLRDPVVGTAPQATDPIGDRRRSRAHQQREAGEGQRDPLEIVEPRQRRVDDQRVEAHRRELVRACGVAENLAVPAQGREPPVEHCNQAAVVIDQRDPDRGGVASACHLRSV